LIKKKLSSENIGQPIRLLSIFVHNSIQTGNMRIKITQILGLLLMSLAGVKAQITISSAVLPSVGDTLKTAVDNLPSGIDVGEPGGNKMWFFNGLQAPFVNETVIRSPNQGSASASFPTATYFINIQNGIEAYYRVNAGKVYNLGFAGSLPGDLNLNATGKYNAPGLIERTTPLRFMDEYSDLKTLSIPFSSEILPDTLLASFPIRPDSIRLRVNTNNTSIVDAWGTMMIPSGSFEVLRVKTTSINQRSIEGKINPLPSWIPLPLDLPGITGTDTLITYTFLSDNAKEAIATVSMQGLTNTAQTVEFKADDQVITSAYNQNQKSANMFAYPNPAMGAVRFDLVGLDPGKYTVKMYNILGVEVWSKSYNITGPRTVRVDLEGFNKGTYLYSLTNDKGRTLLTKRLIVLRP